MLSTISKVGVEGRRVEKDRKIKRIKNKGIKRKTHGRKAETQNDTYKREGTNLN